MDNRLILACAIAGLAACTTQTRVAALRDTEIQLEEARTHASVECSTHADCDRLWSLTKTYVAQRSVTPIRRADETAIETAEPHVFGAVYVWATRTTDDSGASTISIKGMCRGMYRADGDAGWLYESCAEQIRAAEMNFRSFVGAS
ncbi:hypothetical protein [Paraburkholderia aromaticivorans]|uniref:hypothetical protein n=1 Tax=Paraburkholderia aromaticivorans TaxID=2026199 RepID=UPI0014560332|nr:hypothetical protein [Paraburkholderia aromaticivorans]